MRSFINLPASPPAYELVVETYKLNILKGGTEFAVSSGGLTLTHEGEVRSASVAHNALSRLVQTWRIGEPHLRSLFEMVKVMQLQQTDLTKRMEKTAADRKVSFDSSRNLSDDPLYVEALYDALDQRESTRRGLTVYAGCIFVILSTILNCYRNDIALEDDDWSKGTPQFAGQSYGKIVVAVADFFQHGDIRSTTCKPMSEEKESEQTLAAIFPRMHPRSKFVSNICFEALNMLSNGGDFGHLTANLFAFACNLIEDEQK